MNSHNRDEVASTPRTRISHKQVISSRRLLSLVVWTAFLLIAASTDVAAKSYSSNIPGSASDDGHMVTSGTYVSTIYSPANVQFNGVLGYTFCFWYFPIDFQDWTSGYDVLAFGTYSGNTGPNHLQVTYFTSSNFIKVGLEAQGDLNGASSNVRTTLWKHICLTHYTNMARLFEQGSFSSSTSWPMYTGATAFGFGGKGPGAPTNYLMRVRIDEFMWWNRALADTEISTSYSNNQWMNPLIYLPFNEQSGQTAYDRAGNNHYHFVSASSVWGRPMSYDGHLEVDANALPAISNVNFAHTDNTVCAWTRWSGTLSGYDPLWQYGYDGSTPAFYIYFGYGTSGNLMFDFHAGMGSGNWLSGANIRDAEMGNWVYHCFVMKTTSSGSLPQSGTTLSMYRNDRVSPPSEMLIGVADFGGSSTIRFGSGSTSGYQFQFDEIRMWLRAMPAAEYLRSYKLQEFDTTALQFWYPFPLSDLQSSSGGWNTFYDYSGNGNNWMVSGTNVRYGTTSPGNMIVKGLNSTSRPKLGVPCTLTDDGSLEMNGAATTSSVTPGGFTIVNVDWSVCFWYWHDIFSTSNNLPLFSLGTTAGTRTFMVFYIASGTTGFSVTMDSIGTLSAASRKSQLWVNICLTFYSQTLHTGSQSADLFQSGAWVGTSTNFANFQGTFQINFGHVNGQTTVGSLQYVPSRIDEFRMWTRQLSRSEINDGFASGVWSPSILYYPFSEQSGFTAFDQSNSGIVGNDYQLQTGSYFAPPHYANGHVRFSTTSVINNALPSNGVSLSGSDITVCMWTRLISSSTPVTLSQIGLNSGSNSQLYFGYVSGSGLFTFQLSGQPAVTDTTATADTGLWMHRCGVLAGTAGNTRASYMNLYTFGNNVGSVANTGDLKIQSIGSEGIMFGQGPNYYLDDFRLWNRILSDNEIYLGYSLESWPGRTSNLLLFYSFAEQAGTTAFDSSGNGYDWKNVITSTSVWMNSISIAQCAHVPSVADLDIRILNGSDDANTMLAPTTGFSSTVFTYDVVFPAAFPTNMGVFTSWKAANGGFSPPAVWVSTSLGMPPTQVNSGDTNYIISFPDMTFISISVSVPSDGVKYTFNLRSGGVIANPCATNQQDGGHIRFDGTATVPFSPSNWNVMNLADADFTVSLWVYLELIPGGDAPLFSYGADSFSTSTGSGFSTLSLAYALDGSIRWGCIDTSTCYVTTTTYASGDQGQWVHYVGRMKNEKISPGSGSFNFLRNGVSLGSRTSTAANLLILNKEALFFAGYYNEGNQMRNNRFRMDEFRLWRTYMADADVLNGFMYNNWLITYLLLNLQFSEQSGIIAMDSSRNLRHMVLKGTGFAWANRYSGVGLCRPGPFVAVQNITLSTPNAGNLTLIPPFSPFVTNYTVIFDFRSNAVKGTVHEVIINATFTGSGNLYALTPSFSVTEPLGTGSTYTPLSSGQFSRFSLPRTVTADAMAPQMIYFHEPNAGTIYQITLKQMRNPRLSRTCASPNRIDNGHLRMDTGTLVLKASSSNLHNSDFSICMWIKLPTTLQYGYPSTESETFMSLGNSGYSGCDATNYYYQFSYDNSGHYIWTVSCYQATTSTGGLVDTNGWSYMCFQSEGVNTVMYRNSLQVASRASHKFYMSNAADQSFKLIPTNTFTANFLGYLLIDELRAFSRALPAAEILNAYSGNANNLLKLEHFYPMTLSGGTILKDLTIHKNDVTLTTGFTLESGTNINGQCSQRKKCDNPGYIATTGQSPRFVLAPPTPILNQKDFTICLWVSIRKIVSNGGIFACGWAYNGQNGNHMSIFVDSSLNYLVFDITGYYSMTDGIPPVQNVWTHVCGAVRSNVVRSGSGAGGNMWRDGKPSFSFNGANDFYMGNQVASNEQYVLGGGTPAATRSFMPIRIDDFRIYAGGLGAGAVLTDQQISDGCNLNSWPTATLQIYYPMNEQSGTTINNWAPSGNGGFNCLNCVGTGTSVTWESQDVLDSGHVYIDGTGYAKVQPATSMLAFHDITMCHWVKALATLSQDLCWWSLGNTLSVDAASAGRNMEWSITSGGYIDIRMHFFGDVISASAATILQDWTFLCFTLQSATRHSGSGQLTLYVNGVSEGTPFTSSTLDYTAQSATDDIMWIGSWPKSIQTAQTVPCLLDEIRVYANNVNGNFDAVFTSANILNGYVNNWAITASIAKLLFYYSFDNQTGFTITDDSGNGYNCVGCAADYGLHWSHYPSAASFCRTMAVTDIAVITPDGKAVKFNASFAPTTYYYGAYLSAQPYVDLLVTAGSSAASGLRARGPTTDMSGSSFTAVTAFSAVTPGVPMRFYLPPVAQSQSILTIVSDVDGVTYSLQLQISWCDSNSVWDLGHVQITNPGSSYVTVNPYGVSSTTGLGFSVANSDFSFCVWVNGFGGQSGPATIVSLGASGSTTVPFRFGYSSSSPYFTNVRFGTYLSTSGPHSLTNDDAGSWIHYCFTFSTAVLNGGSSNLWLYRNALTEINPASDTINWAPPTDGLYFGNGGPLATGEPWAGQMDDFRMWTTKLSSTDVYNAYWYNTYPLTTMRLFYSFNENGNTVYDYSGHYGGDWSNPFSGGILSRSNAGGRCSPRLALKNIKVQTVENVAIPSSFDPTQWSNTWQVFVNNSVRHRASQSMGFIKHFCNVLPTPPLIGMNNCQNIRVGDRCTFDCPRDMQLIGASMLCQSNGEFVGQQYCVPLMSWKARAPAASNANFRRAGMAYCSGANTLFFGMRLTGATTTNDVYRSDDMGMTWKSVTALPISRGSGAAFHCNAAGALMAFGGSACNYVQISTDGGNSWGSAISPTGMTGSRMQFATALIPSSGYLDFIILNGYINGNPHAGDAWRFRYASSSWELVSANLPWIPRFENRAVYVNSTYLVMMGGITLSNGAMNDVWSSRDDGYTWTPLIGIGSSYNTFWTARAGFLAWAYGGIIGIAFGSTSNFNGGITSETWQSSDGGFTWHRAASSATVVVPNFSASFALVGSHIVTCGGGEVQDGSQDSNACFRWQIGGLTAMRFTTAAASPLISLTPQMQLGVIYNYSATVTRPDLNITVGFTYGHVLVQLNNGVFDSLVSNISFPMSLHRGPNTIIVQTSDGLYTFNILYAITTCSQVASGSNIMTDSLLNCNNVPVGGNCSYSCMINSRLVGTRYTCRDDGTFSGSQTCVVGNIAWNTLSISVPLRSSHGMTVCPTTNYVYIAGGVDSTGASLATIFESTDGLATWNAKTPMPTSRAAGFLLCDGSGVLHFAFGSSQQNSVRSTDRGNSWVGPYSPVGMTGNRDYSDGVLLPSSGNMDFIVASGSGMVNDVWRFNGRTLTWAQVCSSAPWPAVRGYKMVYIDGRVILSGGMNSGGATLNTVWSSFDDGVTWRSVVQTDTTRLPRFLHSLWAHNGILTIAFGSYDATASGGLYDVMQSFDYGSTWFVPSGQSNPGIATAGSIQWTANARVVHNGRLYTCLGADITSAASQRSGCLWVQAYSMTDNTPCTLSAGSNMVGTCSNIPYGGTCSFGCAPGYSLNGAPLVCGAGGTFTGSQWCTASSSWTSLGSATTTARAGPGMTYCPGSNVVWLIGGGTNSGTAVTEVRYSTDGMQTWINGPTLPAARQVLAGVCDAAGTVHAIMGTGQTTSMRLYPIAGSAWVAGATTSLSARGVLDAVLIPSSNYMDILILGYTSALDLYRYSASTYQWNQICTTAPWAARDGYRVTYVGSTLVMLGGKSGAALMNDVWSSKNDGVTWQIMMGTGGPTNSYWGNRFAPSVWSISNRLIVGFGTTTSSAGSMQNDVWQSIDFGATWSQINPTGATTGVPARAWAGNAVVNGALTMCLGGDVDYTSLQTGCYSTLGAIATQLSLGPHVQVVPPIYVGQIFNYKVGLKGENRVTLTVVFSASTTTYQVVSARGEITSWIPVTSGVPIQVGVAEGFVLYVQTPDGLYTFTMIANFCSMTAVAPLIGDNCLNVPAGSNCSFTCPANNLIRGGKLVCQSNGQFSGQQLCQPAPAWTGGSPTPATRGRNGLVYCPATDVLYWGGGVTAPSTYLADVWSSSDGGATWQQQLSMPNSRAGSGFICDAQGTLHVMMGDSPNGVPTTSSAIRLAVGATAWQTTLITTSLSGFPTSPTVNDVKPALIPSSNGMDYIFCHSGYSSCYRYLATTNTFIQTTGSAPWSVRTAAQLIYSRNKLLLIGGVPSAASAAALGDIWSSLDDGVTWTSVLGSNVSPNIYFGQRYSMGVWHYAGSLILYGGATQQAAATSVRDVWQSLDDGQTWRQVNPSDGSVGMPPYYYFGNVIVRNTMYICNGVDYAISAPVQWCTYVKIGVLNKMTVTGITLTAPFIVGQRFEYSGSIDTRFAWINIVYEPGLKPAMTRYTFNNETTQIRYSNVPFDFSLHKRYAVNILTVDTPDGLYTFRLTASPAVTAVQEALRLTVHWNPPTTNAVADHGAMYVQSIDSVLGGQQAYTNFVPFLNYDASGETVSIFLNAMPEMGHTVNIIDPLDGIKYQFSIFSAIGGCAPGTKARGAMHFNNARSKLFQTGYPLSLISFTICSWTYWSGNTPAAIWTLGDSATASGSAWFGYMPVGTYRFSIYGTTDADSPSAPMDTNVWVQTCQLLRSNTASGGNGMRLIYRNGQLLYSYASTTNTDYNPTSATLDTFSLGDQSINDPANSGSAVFNGVIDEVRVYQTLLTSSQILNGFNFNQWSLTSVLYYFPFNEGRGGTIMDQSGNWNDFENSLPLVYPTFTKTSTLCLPLPLLQVIQVFAGSLTTGTPLTMYPPFSTDIFEYSITLPASVTSVIARVSYNGNMAVKIKGPNGPSPTVGNAQSTSVVLVNGGTMSFTLNTNGQANWITVLSMADGLRFSIQLKQACNTGFSDNGHLRFYGGNRLLMNNMNAPLNLGSQTFSFCFWLRQDVLQAYPTPGYSSVIFHFGDSIAATGASLVFKLRGDGVVVLDMAGAVTISTGTSNPLGDIQQWVMWCVVVSYQSSLNLYRNGALLGTASSSNAYWNMQTGTGGNMYWGAETPTRSANYASDGYPTFGSFNGRLDELRFWKRALTGSEISNSFTTNTYDNTNLLAYYPFSEQYGTACFDHSGNGWHWNNCIQTDVTAFESGWDAAPNCLPTTSTTTLCRNSAANYLC